MISFAVEGMIYKQNLITIKNTITIWGVTGRGCLVYDLIVGIPDIYSELTDEIKNRLDYAKISSWEKLHDYLFTYMKKNINKLIFQRAALFKGNTIRNKVFFLNPNWQRATEINHVK